MRGVQRIRDKIKYVRGRIESTKEREREDRKESERKESNTE
jgi:hypothetical protein